jgi:hypothetical protein
MIKLVFNTKTYRLKNYDLSFKMPSPRGTVESFGGFTTVFTQYGDSKETYTLKTNFRKRDLYSLFLQDLYSTPKFDMYVLNEDIGDFELKGTYTWTGNFTEKTVDDKVRHFNKEISFSFIRVV